MKRRPFALIVLLLAVSAGLAAQDASILKVKVQAANVRSQPDVNAAVVRQVKIGTLLESRRRIGDWYEVSTTDDRGVAVAGYINATVVDVLGGGGGAGGQQAAGQPAVAAPVIAPPPQPQPIQSAVQAAPQAQRGGGGFKIMGGLGLGSMNLGQQDSESQALMDKYKQSKTGYAAGLGFALGSRIGIEIDVLYLQKGIRFKGSETSGGQEVEFDLSESFNMLSVPLLLRFSVLDSPGGPSLYVMGGGEVAYVIDGKTTFTFTSGGETESGSNKIKREDLNPIDYGAVFGAGVGLKLGGLQFFVEGRYHLGMSNLDKSPSASEDPGSKSTTSLLLFLAGFKF